MMRANLVLLGLALTALKLSEGKNILKAEVYEDAVFLGLKKDVKSAQNPLKFDHVALDVQGSYDRRAGKFYSERAGYYWVSMSAGARPQKYVRYSLYKQGSMVCSIYRDVVTHTGNETTSRDLVVHMSSMQSLHVTNGQELYSDEGLQTSLAVFRLSDLMSTNVSFYAFRTSNIAASAGQIIKFPTIPVNEGNAFDSLYFTAPTSGFYFLSYSIGVISGRYKYDVSLRRRFSTLGVLERTTNYADDWDLISRGGLHYLNKGDRVHIRSDVASTIRSSSTHRETAFAGFLYEPKHSEKRAWSVAKTTSWSGTLALSPVPFDEILINIGNDWNAKGNFYSVPVSGVYYISVVIGAPKATAVDVALMVDEVEKVSVVNTSLNRNGLDIVSRSAIIQVKKGSMIYLRAEKHTGIHSSAEQQTTFTGLLLFSQP